MPDYKYTNLDRMRDAIANSDWMDVGRVDPETIAAGYRYFDDWLAEHDREVSAKSFEEGFLDCAQWWEIHHYSRVMDERNPYRKANDESD